MTFWTLTATLPVRLYNTYNIFLITYDFQENLNQSSESGDAQSSSSGMKKWKYPRNESFIVDMNNPPQTIDEEEKIETIPEENDKGIDETDKKEEVSSQHL